MEELEAILETGAVAAAEAAASAMSDRGEAQPCPNCGKPLVGPYCAACGQPVNTHRRSLGGLLHEFIKDIVNFDSRILRTAHALLLRPGELPKAFREGRTQPYVPAVRLYLFVTLIFFLFLSASGLALMQLKLEMKNVVYSHDAAGRVYQTMNGTRTLVEGLKSDAAGTMSLVDPKDKVTEVPKGKADGHTTAITFTSNVQFFQPLNGSRNAAPPALADEMKKLRAEAAKDDSKDDRMVRGVAGTLSRLETDPAALNEPLTTWIPRILFVLLPLFAGLLALFYIGRRRDFLFVDHLVFSLTLHSFAFVVLIGAAILAQVLEGGWVALLAWIVLSLYFYLSLKRFYGQGWFKTGVKFVAVSLVYFFFFLCPALGVAIVASVISG